MRKKILATLLVGAVAAAGAMGFSACGKDKDGVKLTKGAEVSEEGWTAAFAATAAAQNYTWEINGDYITSGTVDSKNVTERYTVVEKILYDAVNNHSYSEYTETYKTTGYKDAGIEEEDYDETETVKRYTLKDGSVTWEAEYCSGDEQPAWQADEYGYFSSYAAALVSSTFATEKEGEQKSLAELYPAFKYSGGYYTANLWVEVDDELTEVKLTVSVKDGYFIGMQSEYSVTFSEEGSSGTITVKKSITLSKYGSTTVEAPAEAVAAINAKKTPPVEGGDEPVTPDPVTPSDGSVAGKTYEFYEAVSPDGSANAQTLGYVASAMAGSGFIFGTDDTFTMVAPAQEGNTEVTGTYTQNGNDLVLTVDNTPQDFTLSGDDISVTDTEEGITIKIIYRLKTA